MVVLFLIGEELPAKILPPAVSIIAATLALLVVYQAQVEPVDNVIHDIDWKTTGIFSAPFFVWCKDLPRPVCCKGWRLSSTLGSAPSLFVQRWCCWRGSGRFRVCWPTYQWWPQLW
jgi:hypothetical protein